MSTVEEIEHAIEQLTPSQYQSLREWFEERDMQKWDRQIEADSVAGRLDALISKVDAEIDAKRFTRL